MATLTWTGAGDGTTFTASANWGGTAPQNDDTLIINSTNKAIAGAATGLTGITLRVGPGFNGTLGTSTTYLDLDGPLMEFSAASPEHYLTGTWTDVRFLGGSGSEKYVYFKGNASTVITNLSSNGLVGTVYVLSSASVTNIKMIGSRSGCFDIRKNVSSITSVIAGDGDIKIGSNATTVEVVGGQVVTSDAATFTTVEVDADGTFDHRSTGTITTLNVYEGAFSHLLNETSGFTITNASVYSGGAIRGDGVLNNVTYTNGINMRGGTATVPVGSTISLS
jgi:hypothetical protein